MNSNITQFFDSDGNHRITGKPYDLYGFDRNGNHQKTGTPYNERGFNRANMHRNGTRFDEKGYSAMGVHRDMYDAEGRDHCGRDFNGINRRGFFMDIRLHFINEFIHVITGTDRDPDGYDWYGFNRDKIHLNGTRFDKHGMSAMLVHMNEYDAEGRDPKGRDYDGIDRHGFRWNRYDDELIGHIVTGTDRDPEGYDVFGFNRDNMHRNGTRFDEHGKSAMGFFWFQYDDEGRDPNGRDFNGIDRHGFRWNKKNKLIGHVVTGTEYDPDGKHYRE